MLRRQTKKQQMVHKVVQAFHFDGAMERRLQKMNRADLEILHGSCADLVLRVAKGGAQAAVTVAGTSYLDDEA